MQYPPTQDGNGSDSDYSDSSSSHNDEADHDEERAARKVPSGRERRQMSL
jgi:hypothetical protein